MNGEGLQHQAKALAENLITPEQLAGFVAMTIVFGTKKFIPENLQRLELLANHYKDVLNKDIDTLLAFSISYEQPEITAFLLDYKNKNGLYHDVNWEL